MGAMYEERMHLAMVLFLAVAALAVVQPCTAVPLPLPEWHIHVVNGLNNEPLMVHCQSKDDDLHNQTLATKGQDFNWHFKVNFWGTTLFWCYLRRAHLDVSFDAYWVEKKTPWLSSRCYNDNTCFWIAKEDGIYIRNNPTNVDEFVHEWKHI